MAMAIRHYLRNTLLVLLLIQLIRPLAARAQEHADAPEIIQYGRFGEISLYKPQGKPTSLVLFVSGDGGWEAGVINMARFLAKQGALVAGIDAKHLTQKLNQSHEECVYPAADFEQLSLMLQRRHQFAVYQKPMLVGYSYGATFVYGLICQAPAGTFRGAIALGFSPDININKPFCKGSGLRWHTLASGKSYYFDKVAQLAAPFIILNGKNDKLCPIVPAASFVKGMRGATLVKLNKVGHGFSIADGWLPAFKSAYQSILNQEHTAAIAPSLKTDMPLYIISPKGRKTGRLMFMFSGDGGWTSFDQSLADVFALQGLTVIGLDCQKYFWHRRSPDATANEVARVLSYYQKKNNSASFILMGYSFGACIVPFVANRLPTTQKAALRAIALLSPDSKGDFEVHVSDMLGTAIEDDPYDVITELRKVSGSDKICIFGSSEDEDNIKAFTQSGARLSILPGGHHFDDNYSGIAAKVLELIH